MSKLTAEILIIGGGAAGMSAAAAASEHSRVTIVDDNPHLGGQIWRAELGKIISPEAKRLIDQVNAGRVKIINNAQVYGFDGKNRRLAITPAGNEFHFEKLIIATGGRELFLPFPGWTLPGVYGAGGLQAMVKGGMDVKAKCVVVAGTGPLLLAVSDFLKAKGANVIAIAEQASMTNIARFALRLWRHPGKMVDGISLRRRLAGVPYLTDSWITAAVGNGSIEQVTLQGKRGRRNLDCDLLACGFHLVPSTELAALLGCKITNGCVSVDEFQATSVEHVYCAGEPTGIGGVEASLIEGQIAGLAASGRTDLAKLHFRQRERTRKFTDSLNTAFVLRGELRELAASDTIVCRCEDVEYGRLTVFTNFRDAKLQTRCGMGPCQGRICGAATGFVFGWEPPSVRPPLFPVKMEDL